LITSGSPWQSVEFHPAISSTNSRASELARSYAAELGSGESPLWRVVLTDDQTGGRGRLGRSWEVPPRASVAVSAIVPAPSAREVGWVPLLTGVALAKAIGAVTEAAGQRLETRLKWPNDVLLPADEDRKVAGILCELVAIGDAHHAVVVGTGVNVDQARDELPVETATSLRLAGCEVAREDLVVRYLAELVQVLQSGGALAREEYRDQCASLGADVRVDLPNGVAAEGRAVRVDDSGALVVVVGGVEQVFSAGDVVHLRRGTAGLA